MLQFTHNITDETLTFANSTELKDFLRYQNPLQLRKYIEKIKAIKPELQIKDIGKALKITKSN